MMVEGIDETEGLRLGSALLDGLFDTDGIPFNPEDGALVGPPLILGRALGPALDDGIDEVLGL